MLQVSDLRSGYGSIQIIDGLTTSLAEREILAVMGRNGMGKTTLLKTIMGILPTMSGNVALNGDTITGLATHEIAKRGIAYVPQGRGIFDKLTVEENLAMGLRARNDRSDEIPAYLFETFPILDERRRQLAGTLSGGQKQQLAISRALCSDPRVLLLDEPSEGIQPNIVQEIGAFIRQLVQERPISVLLVEQNLELVEHAASRFVMIEKGSVVHEGEIAELEDETLLQTYLAV